MQNSCSYRAILIGCGTMGERHRRLFEQDGVEFVGVADTSAEADVLFGRVASGNISPDFAVVASPALTHFGYVKRCGELGIPLLVEKPVATSVDEVSMIQELSNNGDPLVLVGHSERYNPAIERFVDGPFFAEMGRYLEQLGSSCDVYPPLHFKFERTHGFSERNHDVSVELDLMIHDMDLLYFFVGSKISKSSLKSIVCKEYTENRVVATFVFDNVVAEFIADRDCAKDCRTVEIVMGPRKVTLDLAAYRSENPALALQKEHDAFLNCVNEIQKNAGACMPGGFLRNSLTDACHAALMVSLIKDQGRKGEK